MFGRTADYDRILPLCAEYEVPVLVDSAESLGAMHHDAAAGSMGAAAVFSFNGNKIMTTSGGGMLVTHDASIAERARYLATQARQPVPWYEHEDVGFNYRMSNVLAALGRAQLRRLPGIIERRHEIRARYAKRLDGVDGISVTADPEWGRSNAWLTTILLPEDGPTPTDVTDALRTQGIEARHLWKPMHLQPVFRDAEYVGADVATSLFGRGVCLPSGSRMAEGVLDEVTDVILAVVGKPTTQLLGRVD